jgi:hypothetical protein
LWKMKRVHFSKCWGFNGGILWRRVQISMNDIIMKTIGTENGNVILEGWYFISSFFFPARKNISNKIQISIPATCASRAKINLDVANASIDVWKMFQTWMKLCFWFFKIFLYHEIDLNVVQSIYWWYEIILIYSWTIMIDIFFCCI